jgi:Ca2+-binding RTX toxin-like protein
VGGAGNDFLIGGTGNDTLTGGAGNNIYRFETHGGHDDVWGFVSHTWTGAQRDHFDVSGLGVHLSQYGAAIHLTDTSAGVLVSVGDTDMLVHGMLASSFSSADFLFA